MKKNVKKYEIDYDKKLASLTESISTMEIDNKRIKLKCSHYEDVITDWETRRIKWQKEKQLFVDQISNLEEKNKELINENNMLNDRLSDLNKDYEKVVESREKIVQSREKTNKEMLQVVKNMSQSKSSTVYNVNNVSNNQIINNSQKIYVRCDMSSCYKIPDKDEILDNFGLSLDTIINNKYITNLKSGERSIDKKKTQFIKANKNMFNKMYGHLDYKTIPFKVINYRLHKMKYYDGKGWNEDNNGTKILNQIHKNINSVFDDTMKKNYNEKELTSNIKREQYSTREQHITFNNDPDNQRKILKHVKDFITNITTNPETKEKCKMIEDEPPLPYEKIEDGEKEIINKKNHYAFIKNKKLKKNKLTSYKNKQKNKKNKININKKEHENSVIKEVINNEEISSEDELIELYDKFCEKNGKYEIEEIDITFLYFHFGELIIDEAEKSIQICKSTGSLTRELTIDLIASTATRLDTINKGEKLPPEERAKFRSMEEKDQRKYADMLKLLYIEKIKEFNDI